MKRQIAALTFSILAASAFVLPTTQAAEAQAFSPVSSYIVQDGADRSLNSVAQDGADRSLNSVAQDGADRSLNSVA